MSSFLRRAFTMYVGNDVHTKEANVKWKRCSSSLEASFVQGRVQRTYHNIAVGIILLPALLVPNTYAATGKLRTHTAHNDIIIEGIKTTQPPGKKKQFQQSLRSKVSTNDNYCLHTLIIKSFDFFIRLDCKFQIRSLQDLIGEDKGPVPFGEFNEIYDLRTMNTFKEVSLIFQLV